MIWIYLSGWICAATYFIVTSHPDVEGTPLPSWMMKIVIAAVLVGLAALWPLLLAARLGLWLWHVAGHPGEARFTASFSKFQRDQQHPLDRCEHESPGPAGDEHEWCVTCGALRKKPNDWILPVGKSKWGK